ncbi:peptide/nickel transport system substrate-binding protein [Thermosporothrix hazakensis]|jgi:ABC-type oligopeptide transport system substrate-binding subunit|uniref:Peptide/nickel transport system substrate-binding protein n=2 Tax=Thermosporothrix TaxID=768650 RepID=A0A326U5X0_THEHA|nr:peptide ABC transporter substrate-binding protein [Thermosporothrix hazakensis]PZW29350.1 peptide/nickel transport system substrate-binding protein [Thermosporothrix hazakensis]BBH86279.1 ABC transporter substrate-binding protein [Thermosporothrix sp. COM3]GCE45300.1 ABC transporter substrate-binding protein [Thermosporothrix hazakensis]
MSHLAQKRRLPVLALLFLSLLVVACGGSTNQTGNNTGKAPDDQQIFVTPITGVSNIATFDPARVGDTPSSKAVNMVYTGLVQLNNNLEVYPQLAKDWQQSEDGLTWTFTLKPDTKFSDGSPLTSKDVVYSIDRAFDPALKNAGAAFYLGKIKDSEKRIDGSLKSLINHSLFAPDPQTVKIVTSVKAPYFLQALTYPCSWVVNEKLVQKYGIDKWTDHMTEAVGAGPFIVQKYQPGNEIVFVPNPNYYGDKPQIKKVVMPFYRDTKTVYKSYETGQVHEAPVQTANMEQARQLPKNQLKSVLQLNTFYYVMNYLTVPFNNLKVRQAFALAIDKEKIAHNVYHDRVKGTNNFVPKGQPGYNENITAPDGEKSVKGNPQKAKQLFEEGLKELHLTRDSLPKITFTVATNGSIDVKNELEVVQSMWKSALGIEVTINDMDFNQRNSYVKTGKNNAKGPMLWSTGWAADYPDPQDWLDLFLDDPDGGNSTNFAHNNSDTLKQQQDIQALIKKADETMNTDERMKLYNQAEQQLINDVALIPIYQKLGYTVRKPCVVGLTDNAQGIVPPNDWAHVYISNETPCARTEKYR